MIKAPTLPPARADVELEKAETLAVSYGRMMRFTLRYRRFDGTWSDTAVRDCFDSGHAVIVLPYDPQADEVVLIRQFRTGPWLAHDEPWILECVAGRLDKDGLDADAVTRAEAAEEAGLNLTALARISRFFTSPGIFSEHITAYCGRYSGQSGGVFGVAAEHEDIRAEVFPAAEAIAMALDGRIIGGPSLVCLYWLALNRDRLRRDWT